MLWCFQHNYKLQFNTKHGAAYFYPQAAQEAMAQTGHTPQMIAIGHARIETSKPGDMLQNACRLDALGGHREMLYIVSSKLDEQS